MYTRNIVILANSIKYSGHCIAGKDLDTGEWIRPINNQPGPFFNPDLQKLFGDPEGPSLLTCVKIPFKEKFPLYYQPENEIISGDSWENIGEYPLEKIGLLEDAPYPCWLGNTAYGFPDNIPASICNSDLPLSGSLHFIKLKQSENGLTISYKPHDNVYHPRLNFHLQNIHYNLGITDIRYPRLGSDDDVKPKSFPDSFVTMGVGQLFEERKAHYKLVVGIIHSGTGMQGNAEEHPVSCSTNNSNSISTGDHSAALLIPEQDAMQCVRNNDCVGERKLEKNGLVFTSAIKTLYEETGVETKQPGNIGGSKTSTALEQIYNLNQEISSLNDKLKDLTIQKQGLLDQVLISGIKQEGKYVLQSSTFRVRQLNLEAFKQLYPQVFMEIGFVKLSDADRILGKSEVTDLCTLKESIKYTVKEINSDNGMKGKKHE